MIKMHGRFKNTTVTMKNTYISHEENKDFHLFPISILALLIATFLNATVNSKQKKAPL